jgi:hypothetical protein
MADKTDPLRATAMAGSPSRQEEECPTVTVTSHCLPCPPHALSRLSCCLGRQAPRAASPRPGTVTDDTPSRMLLMAKPVLGAESSHLVEAASHPEPSPLTHRLPCLVCLSELEALVGEHHHHRLSYHGCHGCMEEVYI